MLKNSRESLLKNLKYAYGLDNSLDPHFIVGLIPKTFANITKLASFPLNIFGYRFEYTDSIIELNHILDAFNKLRMSKKPTQYLTSFKQLFNVEDPQKIVNLIYRLIPKEDIARNIQFYTNPSNKIPVGTRQLLRKIDGQTISSSKKIQDHEVYQLAQEKLNTFIPQTHTDERQRPIINKLMLISRFSEISQKQELIIQLLTSLVPVNRKSTIYLRLEKAGRLQIGKFMLGQDIIKAAPAGVIFDKENNSLVKFNIKLTGDHSVKNLLVSDNIIFGGDLEIFIAIANGKVWSNEASFKFNLRNGKIEYIK